MRVGVDLIEIPRIARALERYSGFRERCFTEAERVGAGEIELSMTHSRELAQAVCVVSDA